MFPLTICSHNRILIAPNGWFDRIGSLEFSTGTLLINVNQLGLGGLRWIVDANGMFYQLEWVGLEPANLLTRIRLRRPVERYSISKPRHISVGELSSLISKFSEISDDIQNSADLMKLLNQLPSQGIVNQAIMLEYLGCSAMNLDGE